MRTLELGQVQESDFYSHVMHDDLDSIVRDIREAHRKDKTTADPQPTLDDVKEKFEQAIGQGSDTEMLIHEFCDKLQIPFEKISSEDFSAFLPYGLLKFFLHIIQRGLRVGGGLVLEMCIRDRSGYGSS